MQKKSNYKSIFFLKRLNKNVIQVKGLKHLNYYLNRKFLVQYKYNLGIYDLEKYIHQCWSELLEIPVDQFTNNDNFQYLGGSKIKMYQLIIRLENYLKGQIREEVFNYCGTIKQLTYYILFG